MRQRGDGASVMAKEDFAGLNGLRLIVRSGAIDARAKAEELFVEVAEGGLERAGGNARHRRLTEATGPW